MLIIRKKLVNSFFFYGTIDLGDRMKKKSLIIILILALCFVGCGKKDDNTKKKKPDEIRELEKSEINDLMELVDYLYYFDINPAKSFKTSELTNQEVLLWAAGTRDMNGVPFAGLEEKALEYLDFSLEPEHINCMTHFNLLGTSDSIYLYDSNTKTFVKNDSHQKHSDTGYYSYVVNRYVSSQYKNGDYSITFVKLFSDTNAVLAMSSDAAKDRNWYTNYFDAKNKTNVILTKADLSEAKDKLDKMELDGLVKYTYTFRLKNGRYVLKSYQIEK